MFEPIRGDAFLAHLAPHREALLAYARRVLVSSDDVEDTVQAAVMRAFRDFARFVEGTSFRAFVFTYVVHEVQNANRRRRRTPGSLVPADEPMTDEDPLALLEREVAYEGLLLERERLLPLLDQEVARALQSLREPEQEAFILRSLGELRYEEVAVALGVPLGTVMTRLHRARAHLRRSLVDLAAARGLLPRPTSGERGAPREV